MYKLFGILLFSLIFTGALAIPFIDLLYQLKLREKRVRTPPKRATTPGVSQLHGWKVGTPVGGGILIIISTIIFSLVFYGVTNFAINWTSLILFISLIGFGGLGFYDDLRKMVRLHGRKIRALPAWQKLLLQTFLGLIIGYLLYSKMGLSSIWLPILTPTWQISPIELGYWFVPFAAFVIVSSSNAFNITDGLDGLSTGLLIIALCAYWYLAQPYLGAYGDVHVFIAVLIGSLLAFLYFNIYPARLFMGDTGSLAFGALLAVVALMINQVLVLPIIGGMFVAEAGSSLIQILSIKYRNGRKIFRIAPLHHHFEALGWDETKVTMRFWLFGAALAFVGLLIATFTL